MKKDALTGAPWLLAVARVFERAGEAVYLVGGAVRNPLMGLPLSDVDMCGPARPERVMALCEGTQVRAVLRAAHFGTVELHVTDECGVRHMAEYTTFREDSYRCGHRPDAVRFTTDIGVDARRRDFSVNALYRRLYDGKLGPVRIDSDQGINIIEGIEQEMRVQLAFQILQFRFGTGIFQFFFFLLEDIPVFGHPDSDTQSRHQSHHHSIPDNKNTPWRKRSRMPRSLIDKMNKIILLPSM